MDEKREQYIVFVGSGVYAISATRRSISHELDLSLYDGDKLVAWFPHDLPTGWYIKQDDKEA